MNKVSLYFLVLLILTLNACKTIFKSSPYQSYVHSLENAGLVTTNMGKQWLNVGKSVLQQPNTQLIFPFKEEVFFKQEKPGAVAYQFAYKKSSKIKFSIKTSGQNGVFLDFFENTENSKNIINEFIKDTTFTYQNDDNQVLLLRLQPHLLINEHVVVEIVEQPKLAFPVQNGKNSDIKSFWGMARDGGARKHEGVDIFNKRGTPILAVADGTVSRVQNTKLGGKVVWQRLGLTGPSIYYAHLDSQLVTDGQKVKKGEVLGLMGNTGNAINTSPHLHFGIYTSGGAIDPKDYIQKKDSIAGTVKKESKFLGEELMVTEKESTLPVSVLAVSTNNVTYQNYDGTITQKENLNVNNKKIRLKPDIKAKYLFDAPNIGAVPIREFNPKESYAVLGNVDEFVYLEQKEVRGWVLSKP